MRQGAQGAKTRVLLTRAHADMAAVAEAVRQAGAEPVCVPAVCHEDTLAPSPLQEQVGPLTQCAAIAFASRRGVQGLWRALQRDGLALPAHVRLFAVGPATAEATYALFGQAPTTALPHTAVGLGQTLLAQLHAGAHVLLPTAAGAGQPLAQALRHGGLTATVLPLYRTVPVRPSPEAVTAAAGVDYIVFTSPSCVHSWAAWPSGPLSAGGGATPPAVPRLLTLGPSTSRAVMALGLTVHGEAEPSSFAGLCALLRAELCPHPIP